MLAIQECAGVGSPPRRRGGARCPRTKCRDRRSDRSLSVKNDGEPPSTRFVRIQFANSSLVKLLKLLVLLHCVRFMFANMFGFLRRQANSPQAPGSPRRRRLSASPTSHLAERVAIAFSKRKMTTWPRRRRRGGFLPCVRHFWRTVPITRPLERDEAR